MGAEHIIAAAAIDWQRKHAKACRLLMERNALSCVREEGVVGDVDDDGSYHEPVKPCFKDYCEPGRQPDDAPTTRPVSEWCPSCQCRDALHRAYREMRRAAGVANRRLQALCRAEKS